jgi:hypothetical protein
MPIELKAVIFVVILKIKMDKESRVFVFEQKKWALTGFF